jgi:hypothetical protein
MLLLNRNPKNLPILNIESTGTFKQDNPEKGLRCLSKATESLKM